MKITEARIQGLHIIDWQPVRDHRGYFVRTYCADVLREHGLKADFVQHSQSYSHTSGTIRGMHFQRAPHDEIKLVRCLSGAVFDVILDLRPSSPTFLQWEAFELSRDNGRQVYVPKGCAHGFQALTDDVEMIYLISASYAAHAATGYRYDDSAFAIDWPLPPTIVSDRDRSWAAFELPRSESQPASAPLAHSV